MPFSKLQSIWIFSILFHFAVCLIVVVGKVFAWRIDWMRKHKITQLKRTAPHIVCIWLKMFCNVKVNQITPNASNIKWQAFSCGLVHLWTSERCLYVTMNIRIACFSNVALCECKHLVTFCHENETLKDMTARANKPIHFFPFDFSVCISCGVVPYALWILYLNSGNVIVHCAHIKV